MMSWARKTKTGVLARVRRFQGDRKGIAAVEFAMIAPILIVMYFVTLELGLAIESSKKVGRTASIVADLVTQNQFVTKTDIDAMMRIGEGTLQPYNRSNPEIRITAIQFDDKDPPVGRVTWSRKAIGTTTSQHLSKDTDVTQLVPAKLRLKDTFLVRVETKLNYKPVMAWTSAEKEGLGLTSAFDSIDMGETFHLRPRMSATIGCGDC
ncbi:MAG: hypothetical protein CMJ42_22140 [Phyllobacteriaceae bacterium]|nr:hypothetical protein [Phyllobacteriaceae bacterium]MBA92617.1 hypothetical protein [Phyllobacteriaceae bacterium]